MERLGYSRRRVYTRTTGGSPRSQTPRHRFDPEPGANAAERGAARSAALASNIAQNYPYSSESEQERAAAVARTFAGKEGLAEKAKAESLEPGREPRWWVWKCTTPGCPGLLHTVGFARNARGVYTLCDTCDQTCLR
jgi:hypothetical protein